MYINARKAESDFLAHISGIGAIDTRVGEVQDGTNDEGI